MKRALLLTVIFLSACDVGPPPPPIVVLAPGEQENALAGLLTKFTDDTGIPVEVEWGRSTDHVIRLIENTGKPVDVLITDGVGGIWRAADRGALRPIQSDLLAELPATVRDPDALWIGIRIHLHLIAHGNAARPITTSFDDLGTPEFAGRVCLSSSGLPTNRSLLAYLIEKRGVREAERLVRRWIKNLALPPFAREDELLDAIRAGKCDYGIGVSSSDLEGLAPFTPSPWYFDLTAAGIGRHAGQPAAAQRLLDWFLESSSIDLKPGQASYSAAIAGFRDDEARLLAERAGYW